jgi:hypothetical protein
MSVSLLWRELTITKVISFLNRSSDGSHVSAGNQTRGEGREASTLAKIYSNSIRNIYK